MKFTFKFMAKGDVMKAAVSDVILKEVTMLANATDSPMLNAHYCNQGLD